MNKRISFYLLNIALLGLSAGAFALPDDEQQEIQTDADYNEIFLDEGRVIFYGSEEEPAQIVQGSMKITGVKIIMEEDANGGFKKLTATGSPALFQQQPSVDQAVMFAKGETIVLDNEAQLLTIETLAELSQEGSIITGQHIDYDIETQRANASGGDNERVRMTIPPRSN